MKWTVSHWFIIEQDGDLVMTASLNTRTLAKVLMPSWTTYNWLTETNSTQVFEVSTCNLGFNPLYAEVQNCVIENSSASFSKM